MRHLTSSFVKGPRWKHEVTWGYIRFNCMILYGFGWMDCWIPPSWFLRHRWCLFHIVCVMLSRCQGLTSKPIETQVAMLPMEGNGMEKLCRDLESWAQRATQREMETALYGQFFSTLHLVDPKFQTNPHLIFMIRVFACITIESLKCFLVEESRQKQTTCSAVPAPSCWKD